MQQVKKYGKKQRMEFLNHVSVQLWGIWEQRYADLEKNTFFLEVHTVHKVFANKCRPQL
jgi:hypothetical protein